MWGGEGGGEAGGRLVFPLPPLTLTRCYFTMLRR